MWELLWSPSQPCRLTRVVCCVFNTMAERKLSTSASQQSNRSGALLGQPFLFHAHTACNLYSPDVELHLITYNLSYLQVLCGAQLVSTSSKSSCSSGSVPSAGTRPWHDSQFSSAGSAELPRSLPQHEQPMIGCIHVTPSHPTPLHSYHVLDCHHRCKLRCPPRNSFGRAEE